MGSEHCGHATRLTGVNFLWVLRLSLLVRETRFFGTGIVHPLDIDSYLLKSTAKFGFVRGRISVNSLMPGKPSESRTVGITRGRSPQETASSQVADGSLWSVNISICIFHTGRSLKANSLLTLRVIVRFSFSGGPELPNAGLPRIHQRICIPWSLSTLHIWGKVQGSPPDIMVSWEFREETPAI